MCVTLTHPLITSVRCNWIEPFGLAGAFASIPCFWLGHFFSREIGPISSALVCRHEKGYYGVNDKFGFAGKRP